MNIGYDLYPTLYYRTRTRNMFRISSWRLFLYATVTVTDLSHPRKADLPSSVIIFSFSMSDVCPSPFPIRSSSDSSTSSSSLHESPAPFPLSFFPPSRSTRSTARGWMGSLPWKGDLGSSGQVFVIFRIFCWGSDFAFGAWKNTTRYLEQWMELNLLTLYVNLDTTWHRLQSGANDTTIIHTALHCIALRIAYAYAYAYASHHITSHHDHITLHYIKIWN